MNSTKTLMLAAAAVLSIGVGGAMAQESAGGFIADNPNAIPAATATYRHVSMNAQPQAGSSDVEQAPLVQQPALYGGAGNGG